jgi:hypothetical protein
MVATSVTSVVVCCGLACTGAGTVASKSPTAATGAFEKLMALQGRWVAQGSQGTTYISYSPAASNTALVETMTGDPQNTLVALYPTMMSVYHLDNDRLVMTHYCGQGNQPRMRAGKLEGGVLRFSLVDVTNLSRPEASHMVAVTFTFTDHDRFRQDWMNRADGKEETWSFEFTRVE